MTTFVQRCVADVGEELDGSTIGIDSLRAGLTFIVLGIPGAVAAAKAQWALSEAQAAEFDELLATLPPTGVVERAAWAQKIAAMMTAGSLHWTGYEDATAIRAKCGLAAL